MIAPLVALAPLFTLGLQPIDPGATPPALLDAARCRDCHPAIWAEWAESRHGRAWTNAIFQREYKSRPLDWCVHCHAPLAPQVAEVHAGGGPLADQGVGCAACHVRDGKLHAAKQRPGSPHQTVADEAFGGPAFCAGCHQFNFPRFDADGHRVVGYGDEPMQDTVAQHARGPLASTPCTGCHARSPAGHLFPGGHDLAMLRRSVTLGACRAGDTLVLTVTNQGAGHHVPTGDVHRHLVARAWRASAPERLAELVLGRTFATLPDGTKRTATDRTLPPGAAKQLRVQLDALGGRRTEPITVELRYVYTIDEFPLPRGALAEPTWQVISRETISAAPRCR